MIVVGAGAAGAPLAARLSDNPARSVLLLEAGPDFTRTDDFPAELLDAGRLAGARPGHSHNWGFRANLTPDRSHTIARGRILGGSTTLNGAYFIRGRRADFDRWAARGLSEWSFAKVLPFFRALENDFDHGDTAVHGGTGPLPVRRALTDLHPVTEAFTAACAELGFVAEPDKNAAESPPGYGPLPVNAVGGVRVNAGIAFVNPIRDRANLTVLGDAFVRRIVFSGRRAAGVEVERHGRIDVLRCNEVILTCGAIKSPHLLALSGVGPRKELEATGINVVVDLAGVGKNFSDHPDTSVPWVPVSNIEQVERPVLFESLLNFTSAGSDHIGDLQIMPMLKARHAALGPLPTRNGVTDRIWPLGVALQHCEARGTITTVSSDARVQPRIDYHYLEPESDRRRLREGIRVAVDILRSEALRPQVERLAELDGGILGDDAQLDTWIRAHLSTAIHASGSAAMGTDPASGAVVDQYGRVYGVTGLRVADTSILPCVPSRGPAATAVMIGTRIAEFVERDHAAA